MPKHKLIQSEDPLSVLIQSGPHKLMKRKQIGGGGSSKNDDKIFVCSSKLQLQRLAFYSSRQIRPRSLTPLHQPFLGFLSHHSLIPFLSVLRCLADHLHKCMLVWKVSIWHKHFSMGHSVLLTSQHLSCWSLSAPALPAQAVPSPAWA